jgi:hypothetical protein
LPDQFQALLQPHNDYISRSIVVFKIREAFLTVILLFTLFQPVFSISSEEEKPAKYILIHLDSVASYYLESEMEKGNLPNIQKTIEEGGLISHAVTYFPSKTPTVISSLRSGIPIEETTLVGWVGENRETGEIIGGARTFIKMMWSKSRLAATNLLYGIPGLDRLAGIALDNVPDYLEKYRTLEFYWYPVDSYGHFFGEEKFLQKLHVFDKHFGRLMNRLDDDVNVIVYADHGMLFGEGVRTDKSIKDTFEDKVRKVHYPNVYTGDEVDIASLAQEIVEQTSIDFTFYRSGINHITGYHQDGTVYIRKENSRFCYNYEDSDPFGYDVLGYNGDCYTADEWLEMTYEHTYPVVPIKMFGFLSNPGSGDILALLDKPKYSQTSYSRKGNHGGITNRDISIPIILRGPDVEFLYDRDTMWLQHLFIEIDNADFNYRPSRSEHYISIWHNPDRNINTVQLAFSPYYRLAFGSELHFTDPAYSDHYQFWGKFDLFRSYLARIWIGAGIDIENGDPQPMGFVRHKLTYRKLSAISTLSTTGNHRFALEYRFVKPLSLQVVNFNSFGLRVHF